MKTVRKTLNKKECAKVLRAIKNRKQYSEYRKYIHERYLDTDISRICTYLYKFYIIDKIDYDTLIWRKNLLHS